MDLFGDMRRAEIYPYLLKIFIIGVILGLVTGYIAVKTYLISEFLFYLAVPFVQGLQWKYLYRRLFKFVNKVSDKKAGNDLTTIAFFFLFSNVFPSMYVAEKIAPFYLSDVITLKILFLNTTGFGAMAVIIEYISYAKGKENKK